MPVPPPSWTWEWPTCFRQIKLLRGKAMDNGELRFRVWGLTLRSPLPTAIQSCGDILLLKTVPGCA
jgi:hypothetical protein